MVWTGCARELRVNIQTSSRNMGHTITIVTSQPDLELRGPFAALYTTRQSAALAKYAASRPARQARVGGISRRRRSKRIALAMTMPKPRQRIERRCHALVPARCNKNGVSTRIVPQIERPTAIQRIRRPAEVESCLEKSARRRNHIIGKARKNGAPTSACHQLP